jgi:hypothetical protein
MKRIMVDQEVRFDGLRFALTEQLWNMEQVFFRDENKEDSNRNCAHTKRV